MKKTAAGRLSTDLSCLNCVTLGWDSPAIQLSTVPPSALSRLLRLSIDIPDLSTAHARATLLIGTKATGSGTYQMYVRVCWANQRMVRAIPTLVGSLNR